MVFWCLWGCLDGVLVFMGVFESLKRFLKECLGV